MQPAPNPKPHLIPLNVRRQMLGEVLCETYDLDVTNLNRLRRTLTDQLDKQDLHDAVYGRNPYRDPSLPSLGT